MERCTIASLKLLCKHVATKTNYIITPLVPFAQQLYIYIITHTLNAEKVLGRKN